MRGRRNFVPAIDAYNEAVRVGLGWGMIPEIQAEALLESGELVVLDNVHLDLELWWQRWRLDSEMLDKLTEFVHEAAAELR